MVFEKNFGKSSRKNCKNFEIFYQNFKDILWEGKHVKNFGKARRNLEKHLERNKENFGRIVEKLPIFEIFC